MSNNFYRLDLADLADRLYNPLNRICNQHRVPTIPDSRLLDLTEIMVDFNLNSRMAWTDHNWKYRYNDFLNVIGEQYQNNDEFFCSFVDLLGELDEYLEQPLKMFLGRTRQSKHVVELRRIHGWALIIDLGLAPEIKHRKKDVSNTYNVGGLEIKQYSPGDMVIRVSPRINMEYQGRTVAHMGTINYHTSSRPNYSQHRPEDLTDEQFEWLAKRAELKEAYLKNNPQPERTTQTLRSGTIFAKKRRMLRAKLGIIRSKPDDLYVNPNSGNTPWVPTTQLDDNQIRSSSHHSASPLRPVPRQRRQNRRVRSNNQ